LNIEDSLMKIVGPLIMQPPTVAFFRGSSIALITAGVMANGRPLMPAGMDNVGVTHYDTGTHVYSPFVKAHNLSSRALDEYKRVGGDPLSKKAYSQQAGLVEAAFDMPISVVASTFERESRDRKQRPREYDEMMARLGKFKPMGVDGIVDHLISAKTGDAVPIAAKLLDEVSEDIEYVASLVWRPEESEPCSTAGLFTMVAGIFKLIGAGSETKETRKSFIISTSVTDGALQSFIVSESKTWEARQSFIASANLFADGKLNIAAALVQEVAIFLSRDIPDETLELKKASYKAAEYWHRVAVETAGEDRPAHAIAVNRGIVASLLAGRDAADLRRRLFMLSAQLNTSMERHADAARDYLRVVMNAVSVTDWGPKNWGRIANGLRMAIGAYGKDGNSDKLIEMIEQVEALCLEVKASMQEELAPLGAKIDKDPADVEAIAKRGMAYMKYGAYTLAHADFSLANMLSPGNAWLISEMGLLSHFMGYDHLANGNEGRASELLGDAMEYFNQALAIAEEGSVPKGLFYARRAALLATAGHIDKALADMERANQAAPKDIEISAYFEALKSMKLEKPEKEKEGSDPKVIPFDRARNRRSSKPSPPDQK